MKTRDPELFVDTVATNALMDALARSASKHNNLALECQYLLNNMSNPDHRSYGGTSFEMCFDRVHVFTLFCYCIFKHVSFLLQIQEVSARL